MEMGMRNEEGNKIVTMEDIVKNNISGKWIDKRINKKMKVVN
jgi:hypothetical protein